jgi:hypothetical protein
MARSFAVTTASTTPQLDASRRGEVTFTVTNTTDRPVRGQIAVTPQNATLATWLTLAGNNERDFSPNSTQQATVQIAVPPDVPAGSYPFRLDIASARNPETDYTEGPTVVFGVPVPLPPPPPPPFRWWIPAAAVAVVLIGVAIWWFTRPSLVEVPAVQGATLPAAIEKMGERQLLIQVTGDQSQLNASVVGTTPQAGEKVKKWTTVTIMMPGPPGPPIDPRILHPLIKKELLMKVQPRFVQPQQ